MANSFTDCATEPSRPLTCNPTFSSFSRCKVSWWSCQPSRQEGDGDGVKIFAPTLWRTCKWTYGDPSGLVCGDHILQFSQGDRQGLLLDRLAAYPRPPVPISRPEYPSAGGAEKRWEAVRLNLGRKLSEKEWRKAAEVFCRIHHCNFIK